MCNHRTIKVNQDPAYDINVFIYFRSMITVKENTSGENRMYFNTKLQNRLVKSVNHTVNI